MLVVYFRAARIDLSPVGRILLEHSLAMLNVSNDFLGHEDRDRTFRDIQLEARSSDSHGGVAGTLPRTRVVRRFRGDVQGEASLYRRNRVQTSIVIVADLRKVCHRLGEVSRYTVVSF